MTKIPGFPVAQPGETLTSVVARHLARSSTPKVRHLKLLGLRITSATSLIPHDLQPFASILPLGHPWEGAPERIAQDHTLIPLFLHFAHPKRAKETRTAIIAGDSTNPAASLGITVSQSRSQLHTGKFCPDCLAHDLKTLGYPVFYRQHQASFVRMCPVHARPLHSRCMNCQSPRNATRMWQVAGYCGCANPLTQPLLETGLDAKIEAGWLWLSQQVSTLLAAPIPSEPIATKLFSALKNGGFASPRGGLDSDAMTEALLDRFDETFLRQLGLGSWCEPPPIKQRPSRVLTRSVLDGRRLPNVLRILLLARLVTDDIAALSSPVAAELAPKANRLPTGYGRRTSSNRSHVDKDAITSALNAAGGKITVAAQRLGVHSYVLAADMRYHRIRMPLPTITARRLGAARIAAVHESLAQGVPKNEIERRHSVSEWTILLIELDQPELGDTHREATVLMQQKKHRYALTSFLRSNPSESRHTFATHHAGSYDWLREYDRAWLDEHLPTPVSGGRRGPRKARKNWPQLDQVAASAIRHAAHQELDKSDRPLRLTRTRLLAAGNALAAMGQSTRQRYPTAAGEASRLAETKDQFLRRTIRWALQEYAKRHIAISTNQLRRVARLPAYQLMEHRNYIIAVAAELELLFDARCALAPWRE